jgi:CheY-like chemotaxis protein
VKQTKAPFSPLTFLTPKKVEGQIILVNSYETYNDIIEKQKALEAGCNENISKPTRKDLLLEMINKQLIDLDHETRKFENLFFWRLI